MIRAVALSLLAALPAAAQDFRGLRPGMHAAALLPVGEPMAIERMDGNTLATYPLPFEHYLEVLYDPSGTIAWLNTSAPLTAPDRPPSEGLRIGNTTLDDVFQQLVAEVSPNQTPPPMSVAWNGDGADDSGAVRLVYSDVADPGILVILTFMPRQDAETDDHRNSPDDPILHSVSLTTRSFLESGVVSVPVPNITGTDPAPFPLPIDEAFPSLIP